MIPNVSISITNGNIGGAQTTNDNIVGVISTGTGAGTLALLTPTFVVSLPDAESKGITEQAEPELYKILKEFYSIEGTRGAKVYCMIAANTVSLETMLDKTNANGAKKLIDFAQGEIKALAVSRKPVESYVPATPQFIDSDAIAALTKAKELVTDYFAAIKPFRVLIGARIHDADDETIFQPKAQDNNKAALVLGGTQNDGQASLGLVLGRFAATPVHRNLGRVKDGALPVNALYIGTKKVEDFATLDNLIDYGYITFTKYPQKAGYFISDDPMATAATDDYRFLANCRVIDKAAVVAYQTYVNDLKDDVDLEPNGSITPIVLKHLEGMIENNINLSMGESISSVNAYIDPNQNLATGSKLKVELRITPRGYLKEIAVELGFGLATN